MASNGTLQQAPSVANKLHLEILLQWYLTSDRKPNLLYSKKFSRWRLLPACLRTVGRTFANLCLLNIFIKSHFWQRIEALIEVRRLLKEPLRRSQSPKYNLHPIKYLDLRCYGLLFQTLLLEVQYFKAHQNAVNSFAPCDHPSSEVQTLNHVVDIWSLDNINLIRSMDMVANLKTSGKFEFSILIGFPLRTSQKFTRFSVCPK